MSGLFVQKHAESVRAQGCDVRVIFSQGWIETWQQWKALRREGWMPDVVQLNVLQKQGLLALYLKKRYGIPYVIVEHWSGFLPENGAFMSMSRLPRDLYKRIAKEAEIIMPVSNCLQEAMQLCGIRNKRWGRIHNVVDDFFFDAPIDRNTDAQKKQKTLLHVSCFDERAKNVKGLLRAAKMLSERRLDWQLVLVGTGVDYEDVRAYADELEIPKGLLRWTGELTPRKVAEEMQRADAFVLSSRYETYGVVLAEAMTAGLPILSTPVGIAEEVAHLIVPQEVAVSKPGRFAEYIECILWHPDRCTDGAKTADPDRFTAESIGKKLVEVYEAVRHL